MTQQPLYGAPTRTSGPYPYQRPRDAATLILIDRTANPAKVLFGKRSAKHVFMPGKFVFPGGRVEPRDGLMPVVSPLHPRVEAKLMEKTSRPSPARARAFALAAIRETFEETGLVVGGKRADAPPVPGGPWADFAKTGFYPDLGDIHFIARAITPPNRPRRFDARFFCADASTIAHRVENVIHPDAELTELVWVPLDDARQLDLPGVTTKLLGDLQKLIAGGLHHDMPIPFFRMQGGVHTRLEL